MTTPLQTETFAVQLDAQTRVTARIDIQRMAQTKEGQICPLAKLAVFETQGTPRAWHFPLYREWISSVWQYIADTLNKPACCFLLTPEGCTLCIRCKPNQKPELCILQL